MTAAFCALVRKVIQRVPATHSTTLVKVLLALESLHQEIILEMIDDSDGLHIFGSVHLEELYDKIGPAIQSTTERNEFKKAFQAAHDNW
jgi:Ca2+-binding EF-hand superfamily protein